jgi:hypothetical protein
MILIDHGRVVYDFLLRRGRAASGDRGRRLSVDFETGAAGLPDGVALESRGRARLVLRFDRERISSAS